MTERFTTIDETGKITITNEEKALQKLKRLEDLTEKITARQEELSELLEKLRNDGKMNSYKFKELMGEKLINTNILSVLSVNDLL